MCAHTPTRTHQCARARTYRDAHAHARLSARHARTRIPARGRQPAYAVAPSLSGTLADYARHHRFSTVENRSQRWPAPICARPSVWTDTQGKQTACAVASSLSDSLADCARPPAYSRHRFSTVENRSRRPPAPLSSVVTDSGAASARGTRYFQARRPSAHLPPAPPRMPAHLRSALLAARMPNHLLLCRVGGGRGVRGCATATAGHRPNRRRPRRLHDRRRIPQVLMSSAPSTPRHEHRLRRVRCTCVRP
jgi:hypothetical protein